MICESQCSCTRRYIIREAPRVRFAHAESSFPFLVSIILDFLFFSPFSSREKFFFSLKTLFQASPFLSVSLSFSLSPSFPPFLFSSLFLLFPSTRYVFIFAFHHFLLASLMAQSCSAIFSFFLVLPIEFFFSFLFFLFSFFKLSIDPFSRLNVEP